MELHPQARELLERSRDVPPLYTLQIEEARWQAAKTREALDAGVRVSSVVEKTIGESERAIRAWIYEPASSPSGGVVVWLHGGGWAVLDVEDADACARRLCNETGCVIVNVGYRRAPESPWPAGVDDAYNALRWAEREFPARPLLVGGDSAGGNLAAVTALRSRDNGGPTIAGQLLVYPVTDHDLTTASYQEHGNGLLLSTKSMRWFWDMYVPSIAGRAHPYASPLRASQLDRLPETILVSAGFDPLYCEVIAYLERLRASDVMVTHLHYDDMQHGFFTLIGLLDRAGEAIDAVGAAVRQLLERSQANGPLQPLSNKNDWRSPTAPADAIQLSGRVRSEYREGDLF